MLIGPAPKSAPIPGGGAFRRRSGPRTAQWGPGTRAATQFTSAAPADRRRTAAETPAEAPKWR